MFLLQLHLRILQFSFFSFRIQRREKLQIGLIQGKILLGAGALFLWNSIRCYWPYFSTLLEEKVALISHWNSVMTKWNFEPVWIGYLLYFTSPFFLAIFQSGLEGVTNHDGVVLTISWTFLYENSFRRKDELVNVFSNKRSIISEISYQKDAPKYWPWHFLVQNKIFFGFNVVYECFFITWKTLFPSIPVISPGRDNTMLIGFRDINQSYKNYPHWMVVKVLHSAILDRIAKPFL